MITRVVGAGLLAGMISGLCIAVLQAFTTTPLILQAEVYEQVGHAHEDALLRLNVHAGARLQHANYVLAHAEHGSSADGGDAEVWAPRDGLERTFYTGTATVGAAVGFALMLFAGMLVSGDPINERRGMVWGAAGFAAAGLAPAVGLSPELPGMAAADLAGRQAWWAVTAAATAGALWLFIRSNSIWLRLLAVVLLLAPHVWGAPQLAQPHHSSVPAHLAAQFAANSLAVQALLWLLTGYFVGVFWRLFGGGHDNQLA